jgi:hypothetical protein
LIRQCHRQAKVAVMYFLFSFAVTWGLSIIYGRVNLTHEGQGNYKVEPRLKNDGSWSMTGTGINVLPAVKNTARLMMLTSLSYFIIQGPAFAENCGRGTTCERKGEQHWWAFAGVLLCMLGFGVYLAYQMRVQDRIKYHQFQVTSLMFGIGDVPWAVFNPDSPL